jgi:hypothetical protein
MLTTPNLETVLDRAHHTLHVSITGCGAGQHHHRPAAGGVLAAQGRAGTARPAGSGNLAVTMRNGV